MVRSWCLHCRKAGWSRLQSGPAACSTSRGKRGHGKWSVDGARCGSSRAPGGRCRRRPRTAVQVRRRERRCSKRGGSLRRSTTGLRRSSRRAVLRVRARDERGASTGMMLHYKSTGISMWRARGDLGLSLSPDMARPTACRVKAFTQRNGTDAIFFSPSLEQEARSLFIKKKTKKEAQSNSHLFSAQTVFFSSSKHNRSQLQLKLVPLVLQVDQRTLRF